AGAIRAMENVKFDLLLVDLDHASAFDVLDFETKLKDHEPRLVITFSREIAILTQSRRRRVHFVLRKPFTSYLVLRTLKAAYHILLKGRRIPFRKSVRIVANASYADDPDIASRQTGTILDISYSGLCLQMRESIRSEAVMTVD